VTIEPGNRGQFDVFVDGDVVATKHAVSALAKLRGDKGFPEDADAVAAVRTKLGR
jgi:hypothetical protein